MWPRSSNSKTHRFLEVLAFLLLLRAVTDSVAQGAWSTPFWFCGIGVILVGLALAIRSLRHVAWLTIFASGLGSLVLRLPQPDGIPLILIGAFLIFDSGWIRQHRVAKTVGIGLLILGAQALTLVVQPGTGVTDLLYWGLVDALLAVLALTFREELFGPMIDDRPSLCVENLGLTPRELQIIHLVWGGETPKQIAGFLDISDGSVRMNLSRIYAKVGVPGLRELSQLVHTHRVQWDGTKP